MKSAMIKVLEGTVELESGCAGLILDSFRGVLLGVPGWRGVLLWEGFVLGLSCGFEALTVLRVWNVHGTSSKRAGNGLLWPSRR